MNPNQPGEPRSLFSTKSYGLVFGSAAVIWAAILFFVNLRNTPPPRPRQQSVLIASALPANLNPDDVAVRENTKVTAVPSRASQRKGAHSHVTSCPLNRPQFIETIHWNLSEGETDMSPLSPAAEHAPITVQLQVCKEVAGKYQWYFAAVNHSDAPWTGKIRVLLLGSAGTLHSEDFTVDTPLEPDGDIAANYGLSLHPFETDAAPKIEGGLITGYGYSTQSNQSTSRR